MTDHTELVEYCERHNSKILREYTTWGESGIHYRAIVQNKTTGEKYYLYYDRSRKRRNLSQQKADYQVYVNTGIMPIPKSRGWRNETLTNRKYRQRQHDKNVSRQIDVR